MGVCNIDHSKTDVVNKLASQEAVLPVDLNRQLQAVLQGKHSQETLNELFHLLKKYDLVSEAEREERNKKLRSFS